MKVDNDWADPTIFDRFQKLLEQCGSKRRLTYLDLGGQDCIIGCATPEGLAAQKKATALGFGWMG